MDVDAVGERAQTDDDATADWQRRVVTRSLQEAQRRSIDRGNRFIRAAAKVLERSNGESLTVQEVADEAGQSLRTLYQYFASKDDLLLAVFEEAMHTNARIIRAAIAGLDDPLERLAGAILAAAHLPAMHNKAGVDRGLVHLRRQLSQADPDLIARSQVPVMSLYRELIEAATADASLTALDIEPATYFVVSARTSLLTSMTIGNEYGVRSPDAVDLSVFCLGGLGAHRPREWHQQVNERLELSGDGRSILRRLARASNSAQT
ncbi:TetR/AcrR family transcriptional regulator [Frankia sp. CNm7]|uniref:TetR/AcrR family transcriptional regulator n=1 Tax=Frankia nepalensis TaxID=1836974 RepID=A0A937RND4_9ACTN|nr:TetR/AcrR family transcriptional regulator [Frankia nepalensis]MBL7498668.1 TetR/AcrR family transcriptional regulator [Frankia nepalensis]MBL7509166.1 TetR/AcrR family transcriptional regulator [Frankia nepalensis]MBL7521219.1 TetR/AcrR family transcriptional regulator [Frankia nepalensis]MBL7633247.1 TetR/AcrR family transcriptional regulator [Frankia nepalensis]